MSTTPEPQLLQRLARRRLRVPRTGTYGGVGDHASVSRGSGLEFAEHRSYQPGDDLRRLDPHLEARTGELFVREFEVMQRLALTVVVDMSASMAYGSPGKSEVAARLAGALAYLGLAGADRTRVAAFAGRGLKWGPQADGVRAAGRLFDWLGRLKPEGAVDFASVARELGARLPRPGLVIVVSDWLFADCVAGLHSLRSARQEVVGVQVLAPEELQPLMLGRGALTLLDAEAGTELPVTLDAQALKRYAQDLASWQERLRTAFLGAGATWLSTSTDADLEAFILKEGAQAGLVR